MHQGLTYRALLVSASALLLIGLGACGSGSSGSGSSSAIGSGGRGTVSVGIIAGLTGEDSSFTSPFINGADLAVKAINAKGGISGRKVALVTEDSTSTVTGTLQAATTLTAVKHAPTMICVCTSSEFIPLVAQVSRAQAHSSTKTLLVNAEAGVTTIAQLPRVFVSPEELDGALAATLVKLTWANGARRIWVLSQSDAYGEDLNTQLIKAWKALASKGAVVLGDTVLTPGQASYSDQMVQVNNAKPQAILNGSYEAQEPLAFKELTALGSKAPFYDLYYSNSTIPQLPSSTGRGFGIQPAYDPSTDAAFASSYQAAYKTAPNMFSAQGYDDVWLSALAVVHGKADSTQSLLNAFVSQAQAFKGVDGSYQFQDYDRVNAPISSAEAQDGKWVVLPSS
jgi:branched-chain amino acid transport system substrate-binding protein